MALLEFVAVLLLGLFANTYAQNFYVAAPNTLRLNSDETVAVSVNSGNGGIVKITVKDHPKKEKAIFETQYPVDRNKPKLFTIRLDPANFPPNFLNSTVSPKLISLNVKSDNFQKELTIPITSQSGYVFIQTDKPIYTPRDRASIRIISLNEESLPSNTAFKLQIKNPDGIAVDEKVFNPKAQKKAFETYVFKFTTYSVPGEWEAIVFYGYNFEQSSTVHFTVKEYVLPTFTVKLETPDVILPSATKIQIKVDARYVYGKKVKGLVTFRLGVKKEKSDTIFFGVVEPKDLQDGTYTSDIKTADIKESGTIKWFPEIHGSHFVVEATVMDEATGNTETAINSKSLFSETPFVISFKRCLQDFKPGLVSVFEANINYVDGKPADGIPARIRAVADGKSRLNIRQDTLVSDQDGKVAFNIQPEMHHSKVEITIETTDPNYVGYQATGNFTQRKFQSRSGAYIALARDTGQRLQPGDTFSKLVHFEPAGIKDIHYLVVSKGRILELKKLPPGQFKNQNLEFRITQQMIPNFRVVIFVQHKDEMLVDSLKIEVQRKCNKKSEVTVKPEFASTEPGNAGKIVIEGTKGTFVGLLGVDEAVYALSKKDLLTKDKIFDTFETHDLGCGPGGGLTTDLVLGYAGITIGSNNYSPAVARTCSEIKRRKREVAKDFRDILKENMDGKCCQMGRIEDKENRTCEERAKLIEVALQEKESSCVNAYLECCLEAEKTGEYISEFDINGNGTGRLRDVSFEEVEILFENLDESEKDVSVRRDFRETWIFDDVLIGPDGKEEYPVSLPHSITTWVIQAVSVSPEDGICVAEPQKLVAFQKVFIHLNLPYSVMRNEQVEIQATIFNYGTKELRGLVYMYGVKDLCSAAHPGEKSERKKVVVEGNSAATVYFPIIPLKAEAFNIKVVALSGEGSDAIERILHVVPEGVRKDIDVSIKLDPSNQQRRRKRDTATDRYTDNIDSSQNLQVSSVDLNIQDFVPGTERCTVSVIGDEFGPTVETALHNPDGLIQKPSGCGEQNMIRFAPTMYTLKYLKITGKLTDENQQKGYGFLRDGYANQMLYRKPDGSFAAFQHRPASTWLTAFVTKVFCQANEFIDIPNNVRCGGVQWLIKNQEPDGSYVEKNPVYHRDMTGGVKGKTAMTAYALIAMQECKCDEEHLHRAKLRAVSYLELNFHSLNTPLPAAIVAYALALSNSEEKGKANEKLLAMSKYDEDTNRKYWKSEHAAEDVETAGYALMTQLLFNDIITSNSIVNWLNTQRLQSGSFKSTQDTVVALQALSEHATRAQMPSINLVTNASSSSDKSWQKDIKIQEHNALQLQKFDIKKVSGRLFFTTTGHGVGSLSVNCRYNVIVPPEEICKFDMDVTVSNSEDEGQEIPQEFQKAAHARKRDEKLKLAGEALGLDVALLDDNPRHRNRRSLYFLMREKLENEGRRRIKRQKDNDDGDAVENVKLNVSVCVRYLGDQDAGMSIVDVGIFSGFKPVKAHLEKLEKDAKHLIQKYEESSRSVVFYLERVPKEQKYCFSFDVIRDYIIGETQMSIVKVYDYYNPDAACSKFYKPDVNSPILRTICEGGVCECAEGGCPPKKPFDEFYKINDVAERRDKLKQIACDNYDYVWKGRPIETVNDGDGFLKISFMIDDVFKHGIEKTNATKGKVRTLYAQDTCDNTIPKFKTLNYLLLGKDGQKYQDGTGKIHYRYLLDGNSVVQLWQDIKNAENQMLQRDLNHVTRQLSTAGCDL